MMLMTVLFKLLGGVAGCLAISFAIYFQMIDDESVDYRPVVLLYMMGAAIALLAVGPLNSPPGTLAVYGILGYVALIIIELYIIFRVHRTREIDVPVVPSLKKH